MNSNDISISMLIENDLKQSINAKHNYNFQPLPLKNSINIDKESADKLFRLLEILEDNDDVQGVSSNFEVDEAVMSSLTS